MTSTIPTDTPDFWARLADPFPASEIKWKPQSVKGNRALALAYIDARLVEDRLDDVAGPGNWEDLYEILLDGSVMCRLRIRMPDGWVTKMDVGSQSDQPDGGDRMKAAFSDALKRTAVKWGIGRYLYRIPTQWHDYDPVKKCFTNPPKLGPNSLPKTRANVDNIPRSGKELAERVLRFEREMIGKSLCATGELVAHVTEAGGKAGFVSDIAQWTGPALSFGVAVALEFYNARKGAKTPVAAGGGNRNQSQPPTGN